MNFKEKISIVLKLNKLGIATIEDLSEKAGFHPDTIRKAIERGSKLNKKNTRIFQDKYEINRDWWETGKGEPINKKSTPEVSVLDEEKQMLVSELKRDLQTLRKLADAHAEIQAKNAETILNLSRHVGKSN